MAVAMTNAFPLMTPATIPIESEDTDRVFRKMIATLLLPDVKSANPLAVRNGVIPHTWDGGAGGTISTCSSLRPSTNTGMNITVGAGPAVVERTGQGPYIIYTETDKTVPISTSNPTNPRIDVVYAWVGDQVSFSGTDASQGPLIDILVGVPSATPVVRTDLPDGAVALANVRVEAAASSIPLAKITDVRTATGLLGGVRYMLPGDKLSDPGRVGSELRLRQPVAPFPMMLDYWDNQAATWRGTIGFSVSAVLPGTPDANQLVRGSVSFAGTTITSVSIPDPGYPYRIKPSCTLQTTAAIATNFLMKVSSGTIVGRIVSTGATGLVFDINPATDVVFTGAQTVSLTAGTLVAGTGGWQADVRNKILIEIVPA